MPSDAPERITVTKTRFGDLSINSKGEPMTLQPGYTEHVEYVRADLPLERFIALLPQIGGCIDALKIARTADALDLAARDADLTAAREALRLAVPIIRLNLSRAWNSGDVAGYEASIAALRAALPFVPDALDGAPEWIVEAVQGEKPDAD